MLHLDVYSFFYDIIAYVVAARSLIDELLYKFHYKKHLDIDNELPSDLTGHVAIVTGGTRGIGLHTVRALIAKGCDVFVGTSQTSPKFIELTERIYSGVPISNERTKVARGVIHLQHLDLASMDSVVKFANEFRDNSTSLNYLICNAGIMFAPRSLTNHGFESHLAINYLGHTLLIHQLIDTLKRTADATKQTARIVCVSSSTHHITGFQFDDLRKERQYSSSQAYAQSKIAQIMFVAELAHLMRHKFRIDNVECYSLHPGVILSDLYEHVKLVNYFPFLKPIIRLVTRDMLEGAETTLYAALSKELNGASGAYLEDCAIKTPSSRALDKQDRRRLWDLTDELLKPWLGGRFEDKLKQLAT